MDIKTLFRREQLRINIILCPSCHCLVIFLIVLYLVRRTRQKNVRQKNVRQKNKD